MYYSLWVVCHKETARPHQKKYYTVPSLPSGPVTVPTANERNNSGLTQIMFLLGPGHKFTAVDTFFLQFRPFPFASISPATPPVPLPEHELLSTVTTAVQVNSSTKHQLRSLMKKKNPCENPERGRRTLSTIILNIVALFIHFWFLRLFSLSSSFSLSLSLSSPFFRDPFFLIAADEDGDFITGLLWIIMWCNWPSGPVGGALLQLICLDEALLCPGGGPPHSWGPAGTPLMETLVKCNML